MTTYRLLNDTFHCHEAFIDFKALRKQFKDVKVWFPQENISLIDKLNSEWAPVDVRFTSDSKNNSNPDISVWNMSCLVLSDRAYKTLEPMLCSIGEFLPLKNNFYLFNCLSTVSDDAIDQSRTAFNIENNDINHIPKSLGFIPNKIAGKVLFKPGFAENSFLICQNEFKRVANENKLSGVIFEEGLAQIFQDQSK